MKTCACIISYYPDIEELKQNIKCYIDHVEEVIIWQNTPTKDRGKYVMPNGESIKIMGEGDNVGISVALNKILSYCKDNGFELLLTMDQDSKFKDFEEYLESAKKQFSIIKTAIAFGPEVNDDRLKKGEIEQRNYLITSGSIVSVEKAIAIGGYTEKYFVDGIDIDFGYKAQKMGFTNHIIGGFALDQSYGKTQKKAGIKYAAYPPYRLENIVAGYWNIITDYRPNTRKLFLELANRYYIRKTIAIILFQNEKYAKIKAILKGTLKGLKYFISH